jgi:hypothetical protein
MRLPSDSQRHAIYGQTGSGKTVAGLWALEKRSWTKKPWVIIDLKRDPMIRSIPRLEEVEITSKPPRHAGLYVTRPTPGQEEELSRFFWDVWRREKTGLFVDESAMIDRFDKGWKALLTQGRSKQIPIIGLTQRPSWLSPWFMSQVDFHQVLFIQSPDDFDTLYRWVPGLRPTRLNFHSQYYDVGHDELTLLKPVPNEAEILDRFDRKMPRPVARRMLRDWTGVPARKPLTA